MKNQSRRLILNVILSVFLAGLLSVQTGAAVRPAAEVSSNTAMAENGISRIEFNTAGTEKTVTASDLSLTWKKVGNHLRLQDSRGKYKKGFVTYRGHLYYFDKKGNLKTGFFTVSGKKYYASKIIGYKGKGQILTGIVKIGPWFFYLNPFSRPYAGAVSTGFRRINGRLYYFDSKGHMAVGWFTVSGNKYYASVRKGQYGKLLTGIQRIGNNTYRFDTSTGKLLSPLSNSSRFTHMLDISEHQGGSINFNKVRASGVRAVIIRAGYGFSTVDRHFYTNIKKARAAGLRVGIYWFSYAYRRSQAVSEAKYCLRVIKKYNINLPVYFDWEYASMDYARRFGAAPGRNEITEMTYAFCDTISRGGRRAGYYFNQHYLNSYYTPSRLKRFSTWYAYWGTNQPSDYIWERANSMPAPTKFDVWQFSSRGRIPGISGDVDCDLLLNGSILK